MVDVGGCNVMLLAQPCSHVDMGDVIASGRIDPIERLEKDPVVPEGSRDLSKVGVVLAGEAEAQFAAVASGIGVVKASLSLQGRFAAWGAVLRQGNGQQSVADRATLAQ